MVTTLRIDSRFRGPPTSGNGGYVAGMLAEALGGSDCQVTLLKPPPLDRDLELRFDGPDRSLWDGDELIAAAKPAVLRVKPPPPPDLIAAEAASARFAGHAGHIFPGCFVCGPERTVGDGLRIFAGPLGPTMVSAPWQPSSDLCDDDGVLRGRFLWAALDCPGYFAVQDRSGPAVLGRFAVHVAHWPKCDRPLVVAGWPMSSDGRKHHAATALYADERVVAIGHAIWISLDAQLSEQPLPIS